MVLIKKILLLNILFTFVCFAQPDEYDIIMVRGDKTIIRLVKNNDYTGKELTFGAKLSTDIDADRLIQKQNTLAGGDSSQIYATYHGFYSEILITLLPEDHQDLIVNTLYYDVEAVDVDDSTNVETILTGTITLTPDVLTPMDGLELAASGVRIFTVALPEATNEPSIYVGYNSDNSMKQVSYDGLRDSMNIGTADTIHFHPIGKVMALQDSLDDKLNLDDSTLYATQYDISQLGTADTSHYINEDNVIYGSNASIDADNDAGKIILDSDSVGVRSNLDVDGNIIATNPDYTIITTPYFEAGLTPNYFKVSDNNIYMFGATSAQVGSGGAYIVVYPVAKKIGVAADSVIILDSDSVGVRGNLDVDGTATVGGENVVTASDTTSIRAYSTSLYAPKASPSFTGIITLTNGTTYNKRMIGSVQTTNATVTTIITVPIPTSSTVNIMSNVTGLRSDNVIGAGYIRIGTYRNNAGTVSIIGGITATHTAENNASWNCTYVISGTNVLVSVIGMAATTINWAATSYITYR